MFRTTLLAAILLSLFHLGTPMASILERQNAAAPVPQLGRVNFPTTCSADAQPSMETAVALLHSFQYQQADQSFQGGFKKAQPAGPTPQGY